MDKSINIFQRHVHDVPIKLTKREGAFIKDEIKARISTTFPWYCKNLDIKSSNFYSIMDGTRTCTLNQLNRILSGAGLMIVLKQELVIQECEIGHDAKSVPYQEHEDEFLSDETEGLEGYE